MPAEFMVFFLNKLTYSLVNALSFDVLLFDTHPFSIRFKIPVNMKLLNDYSISAPILDENPIHLEDRIRERRLIYKVATRLSLIRFSKDQEFSSHYRMLRITEVVCKFVFSKLRRPSFWFEQQKDSNN